MTGLQPDVRGQRDMFRTKELKESSTYSIL